VCLVIADTPAPVSAPSSRGGVVAVAPPPAPIFHGILRLVPCGGRDMAAGAVGRAGGGVSSPREERSPEDLVAAGWGEDPGLGTGWSPPVDVDVPGTPWCVDCHPTQALMAVGTGENRVLMVTRG
jgi:hypothetical protein